MSAGTHTVGPNLDWHRRTLSGGVTLIPIPMLQLRQVPIDTARAYGAPDLHRINVPGKLLSKRESITSLSL